MATIQVVKLDNSSAGQVELHEKIAEAPLNPFIIKDSVVAYAAKMRAGTHKAKGRAEVTGSRKKLFRQKGTGNARVGSAQSPVRRGGGVVFGPVVRSHDIKINKRVKKNALGSVIAEKIRKNLLIVVEDLKLESHKTKELVKVLETLKVNKGLFVMSEEDKNFALAARNLQNVSLIHCTSLNVYETLKHEHLVITKSALQEVEGRLLR